MAEASTTSTPVVRLSVAEREALAEVRYWLKQARMEARWYRASVARARAAARAYHALRRKRKGGKARNSVNP